MALTINRYEYGQTSRRHLCFVLNWLSDPRELLTVENAISKTWEGREISGLIGMLSAVLCLIEQLSLAVIIIMWVTP